MSKPRVTTDDQDRELAEWYSNLKRMGTVQAKARELGISVCAVYDAISRGNGQPTAGTRFKLRDLISDHVPRESIESVLIGAATARED